MAPVDWHGATAGSVHEWGTIMRVEYSANTSTPKGSPRVDADGAAAFLERQPDVVLAYLFGSVARGRANALSDVDVAVLLDDCLDPMTQVERQVALIEALDTFADREVQVVLLNRAPPLLRYDVIRYGALLHERTRAERVAFAVHTMKVYFDLQPRLEEFGRALLKRVREGEPHGRPRRHSGTLDAARRIHERLVGARGR